jgi:hypothetical protein
MSDTVGRKRRHEETGACERERRGEGVLRSGWGDVRVMIDGGWDLDENGRRTENREAGNRILAH